MKAAGVDRHDLPDVPARIEAGIGVVIAEPHATFRHALQVLLSSEPMTSVAAAVNDLRSAGIEVRRHAAHVLVVDASLFSRDGRLLGPLPAPTAVVVAGMDDDPRIAAHFRREGALTYVIKDDAHNALPAVLAGIRRDRAR
jgi:DNA-binding NarL/FixJ family response regulator